MATFTNQASLTYSGGTLTSNVAVGEILNALSIVKNAAGTTYTAGEDITYTISLVNSGTTALSGVTVSDNLGAYTYNTSTLYPLTYKTGSLLMYTNGVLQTAPTVTAEQPLTITGITVPAGGNVVLIYEATPNTYAPPASGGTILNTATLTGAGLTAPVTATETVTASTAPALTITKNVEPVPVTENGTLTYTFTIQNYGNTEAGAADAIVLSDTFNPLLSNLTATRNGTAMTLNTDYTYNTATGAFATTAGTITVPAATYTQDATTGAWSTTPGVTTVVVSGTV